MKNQEQIPAVEAKEYPDRCVDVGKMYVSNHSIITRDITTLCYNTLPPHMVVVVLDERIESDVRDPAGDLLLYRMLTLLTEDGVVVLARFPPDPDMLTYFLRRAEV